MKIWVPRSKLIVKDRLGLCSYYDLPYFHATEFTYFGKIIDHIVRFDGEVALIMPDPLPSDLRKISPFKGDIILNSATSVS